VDEKVRDYLAMIGAKGGAALKGTELAKIKASKAGKARSSMNQKYREAIKAVLIRAGRPLTAREIGEAVRDFLELDRVYKRIGYQITKLTRGREIHKIRRGVYEIGAVARAGKP
jgi:hypothetical protein